MTQHKVQGKGQRERKRRRGRHTAWPLDKQSDTVFFRKLSTFSSARTDMEFNGYGLKLNTNIDRETNPVDR